MRRPSASDREITRAFGRVSGGFPRFPSSPLVYKDFDAYVAAAWRDAIVKALRAYRATSDHLFSVLLDRLRNEARFLRRKGRQEAPQGARAPRVAAQRRAHAT